MSGQARDDITIAIQENYDPENPEPLRLEAADLDPLAGSLAGDSIEGTTTAQWTSLAATGEQPHRGRWRVFARVEVGSSVADALDVQARLVYRAGDGPLGFTDRPVVIPHLSDSLIELDLGVANIGEVSGTHSWSGQVQFKAATAGRPIKLRELLFMPATGYARARAPRQPQAIESVVAYDDFAQSSGALDGKTAPFGGDWDRVAGDLDDFTISDGRVERSTINDTAIGSGPIGILERLGTGTAAAITAQVDVSLPTSFASGSVAGGLLLRYVDADNYLVAVRGHSLGGATAVYLMKVIAGAATILSYSIVSQFHQLGWYSLGVFATSAEGGVGVFTGPRGASLELVTGIAGDPDLATGGVLDDGGYGLHDASSVTSGSPLRLYDNFQVSAAAPADHVIHPDESLRLTHEKAERESEDGTRWGRVPHFEGARLKVPPSTRNSYVHRLVVKQDRNDLTQLPVGDPSAVNLCTNPSAETDTAGWTPSSTPIFERVTSPPAGAPAATAFHVVGNSDGDTAFDTIAVVNGRTYQFAARVYLDASTANGLSLEVRNAAGTPKGGSGPSFGGTVFSSLDDWGLLVASVTADATEDWTFRVRQNGPGDTDFYYAAVSIREVDELAATLTVRPRVLLTS